MALETIPWSQIEAECGDYRKGFVATFRKYEGQRTDEKDAMGRTVKVTAGSFAKHLGIADNTFRRWIASAAVQPRPARSKNDLTRDVTRAARNEPEAVIEGIMKAPESTQDRIFHELKLRRAGEDRSPAARKAAQARVHEAMQPVREAFARTAVELCILGLRDATEQLIEAASEGSITEESMGRIDKAHEEFVIARHEAAFKMEVGR